jgi:hypothetical protein
VKKHIKQTRSSIQLPSVIRYSSYVFMGAGGLLSAYFVLVGGPNKGEGRHLLSNDANPYLDIQVGLILLAIGLLIPLIYRLVMNVNFGDTLLDVILKLELGIVGLAAIWTLISLGSLAGALTGFILFLLVPLIPIIVVLSVIRYKEILKDSYNRLKFLAIIANWGALVFMIINVTN